MVREQRNSNIEGLRIIAMSFIVMGHFIAQSGYSDQFLSINSFILKCLGSGSRIAVNIFLLISVWYMVDSCFQAKKILKTYAQVWLFSAPLTLIALSVDVQNISIKAAAQGFFPFIGRGLWFASAYITLILFKPFLDMILQWEKRQRSLFVILLLFFISFVSTLPDMQNAYVCDSMWFLVVYLTVGDFKRRSLAMAGKASLYLISGGGGVYLLLVTLSFLGTYFAEHYVVFRILSSICNQYLLDIKTIPNFLCAFFIFLAFIAMPNRHCKTINGLAKPLFSVYIIHQVPAFYPYMWKNIFRANSWAKHPSVLYVIFVFGCIYTMSAILEMLQRKTILTAWEKSAVFSRLENIICRIYKCVLK